MSNPEQIEKGTAHIIIEIIEYEPSAVVSKTIVRKTTGNITATSVAIGEEMGEKNSPFDTYVQIIDGVAQVHIDDRIVFLKRGEGMIIPAFSRHSFFADEQFKMLTTVIKSGYDDNLE
jgi:mannose-6-phosphate isomerase-like protein (cupin superfamily)